MIAAAAAHRRRGRLIETRSKGLRRTRIGGRSPFGPVRARVCGFGWAVLVCVSTGSNGCLISHTRISNPSIRCDSRWRRVGNRQPTTATHKQDRSDRLVRSIDGLVEQREVWSLLCVRPSIHPNHELRCMRWAAPLLVSDDGDQKAKRESIKKRSDEQDVCCIRRTGPNQSDLAIHRCALAAAPARLAGSVS